MCCKHPDVLRIEGTPLLEPRPVAVLHERGEIARVVGVGVRGEPALRIHVTPKPGHPFERRRFHRALLAEVFRRPARSSTSRRSALPCEPGIPYSCPDGSDRGPCYRWRGDRQSPVLPAAPGLS